MCPLPLSYVERCNFHVLNIPGVFEGVFSPDQQKKIGVSFCYTRYRVLERTGGVHMVLRTHGVHMQFIAHTSITAGILETPRMKSAVSYAARLGSEVEPSVCGAFT